jgi:integrase
MLTDTSIRKSTPGPVAYRLTDGRGLYLTVTPAGGKLWRYKYRFEGSEKLMTFGQYPEVGLAGARERHAAARKLLAEGNDPMAVRRAHRLAGALAESHSFASVAALWLEHWKVGKSPRHADVTRRRLEVNVYPAIGAMSVADIEAPHLVAMAKAVEARGVGDLARRSLETTGQVFRHAIAHGFCSRNPAADIKPRDVLRPLVRTNLARVDAKALPALLAALEVYPCKVVTRLAVKLMALTFVRTSELIGGLWEEIDWEARRWNIPAERMKMKTPHIVPLSSQAITSLRLLQKITGKGPLLFPGDVDARKTMSNNTILHALRGMGYGGVMTGHGFRGLASTLLHEQGWPHDHIELQLAHAPRNAVSAAYNHALYLAPRAEMMEAWGNYLEKTLLEGLTS